MAPSLSSSPRMLTALGLLVLLAVAPAALAFSGADYADLMGKSLLFYEAQRSGHLPASNRIPWRQDSALTDGADVGLDLTGGYYDAGDNVKFGFPHAYTITVLSWGVYEHRDSYTAANQLDNVLDAIKWGADFMVKCHPQPNVFYGQVGDGNTDHACWMRPETMTTNRPSFAITAAKPGSDLAGEAAAALAAASIVLRAREGDAYADMLLTHARQLHAFADTYRGKYSDSITNAAQRLECHHLNAKQAETALMTAGFYNSWSGYGDELLWGAIWLHLATGEVGYKNYVLTNWVALGGDRYAIEFSWDDKTAANQVLMARIMDGGDQYVPAATYFACEWLPNGRIPYTPNGMAYDSQWGTFRYTMNAAFVAVVHADWLQSKGMQLQCQANAQSTAGPRSPASVVAWARGQVDYMLGANPLKRSFVVGWGSNPPLRPHHRGASIPDDGKFYDCGMGYGLWYQNPNPNPNALTGAIVGGPTIQEMYADARDNYVSNEVAIDYNAAYTGLLARLADGAASSTPSPSPTPPKAISSPPPKAVSSPPPPTATTAQSPPPPPPKMVKSPPPPVVKSSPPPPKAVSSPPPPTVVNNRSPPPPGTTTYVTACPAGLRPVDVCDFSVGTDAFVVPKIQLGDGSIDMAYGSDIHYTGNTGAAATPIGSVNTMAKWHFVNQKKAQWSGTPMYQFKTSGMRVATQTFQKVNPVSEYRRKCVVVHFATVQLAGLNLSSGDTESCATCTYPQSRRCVLFATY
eukprot:jgi/Chlat1/6531/Chrsp45S00474